ncbi:MAG TPA: DMT family transporter [Roseiflexaceae bacterium]|nr:DMT family transporter [Roseiflexaceae bacterium]
MASDTRSTADARRGLLLIVFAAVLWGTVGVATRATYEVADTNALSIGFYRLLFSLPVLLVVGWRVLGGRLLRIARRDMLTMGLVGIMMAIYQVCLFSAIPLVGVSIAVLITLCVAPVIVALGSAALFGEKPTARVGLALAGALGGSALLVAPDGGQAGVNLVGVLFALGSAAGYATLTLCSRSLASRYHPIQPLLVGFAAGAALLLPFALLNGLTVAFPAQGWALLVYLGVVPTTLAYVLFMAGIRHVSATVASIITLLEPLTAAALAWLFFGERLGGTALLGAALLLGAIIVLSLPRRAPAPAPQAEADLVEA